jgi:hypothetical protein
VLVIPDGGKVGILYDMLEIVEPGINGLIQARERFVFLPEQRIAAREVIQDTDPGVLEILDALGLTKLLENGDCFVDLLLLPELPYLLEFLLNVLSEFFPACLSERMGAQQ